MKTSISILASYEDYLIVRHAVGLLFPECVIKHVDTDVILKTGDIRSYWKDDLCMELKDHLILCMSQVWFKALTKRVKIKYLTGIPTRDFMNCVDITLIPSSYLYLTNPEKWKGSFKITPKELEPERTTFNPDWLNQDISLDLETTGLHPKRDKIIAFSLALNKQQAIAYPFEGNRELLSKIILEGTGKLIFHNAAFDLSFLVQEFFPNDWVNPFKYLFPRFEDTKLIAWLALNSVSRPDLSLKALALPFLGHWSQGIQHNGTITPEYLEYAKKDAQAVWYVWNQYRTSIHSQESLYQEILKPAVQDIVQMQLTGLPLDMRRVLNEENLLQKKQNDLHSSLHQHPLVQVFVDELKSDWVINKNRTLKKKRVTYEDCPLKFNPKSNKQLVGLLYKQLGLPVFEYTKSFAPSVSQETLKKLQDKTDRADIKSLLGLLNQWALNEKMLNTYFPIFKEAWEEGNYHFLMGHFNLGGTVSGRLSSSNPNLQNLPSTGTVHSKTIKSLFKPPQGWWLVGMDFDSLEDRISALLTKDENKLKVYRDGYDGHSLRAYQYFKNQMPDIEDTVESINSIKHHYPELRQASKGPTFALTYQGSWKALERVCGLSESDSKRIEAAYHQMYETSDRWVRDQLKEAWSDGFVTGAFGLRIRTPLMKASLRSDRGSEELQKEMRTAGNALGQSWCLLNSRACSEVLRKARQTRLEHSVLPCAQIHDASYFLIKADVEVLWWWVQTMEKAASWQEAEEIKHDVVKLSGTCVLYEPDWSHEIPLSGLNSIRELKERIQHVLPKETCSD